MRKRRYTTPGPVASAGVVGALSSELNPDRSGVSQGMRKCTP